MRYFIALFIIISTLWGEIGVIGASRGDAVLERAKKRMQIVSGMALEQGDRIVTSHGAKVQLLLHDDTTITVGENSVFELQDYSLSNAQESRLQMQIHQGYFRTISGKIGKIAPERFKLKTRSATIGIRGTDFGAFVQGDTERIGCFSGQIEVSSATQHYLVDADYMIELVNQNWNLRPLDIKRFTSVLADAHHQSHGVYEGIVQNTEAMLGDFAWQDQLLQSQIRITPDFDVSTTPPPFIP